MADGLTRPSEASRAAELAARQSYGRLVALLAKRTRHIAVAEDALADAFAAALIEWPRAGVPVNPEAWLMRVAQRRAHDRQRRMAQARKSEPHLVLIAEELAAMAENPHDIPDERLALMFACAHPAIDQSLHAPLMLQCVLGLTAEEIGAAFLVAPATMGQRLSRAKAKIAAQKLAFEVPGRDALPRRLPQTLEAIYAAFGTAWGDAGTGEHEGSLAEEAIWLARAASSLLPRDAEAQCLLALMLFLHARRKARRDGEGAYVPLSAQETAQWDTALLQEAEGILRRVSSQEGLGRYECEAAIQCVHAARRFSRTTDWSAVLRFYDALHAITGSPVVLINRAVALAECQGAEAGLASLPAPEHHPFLLRFQPYHAVRAELLSRAGDNAEAQVAYELAIGLEADPAVRQYLLSRRETSARLL